MLFAYRPSLGEASPETPKWVACVRQAGTVEVTVQLGTALDLKEVRPMSETSATPEQEITEGASPVKALTRLPYFLITMCVQIAAGIAVVSAVMKYSTEVHMYSTGVISQAALRDVANILIGVTILTALLTAARLKDMGTSPALAFFPLGLTFLHPAAGQILGFIIWISCCVTPTGAAKQASKDEDGDVSDVELAVVADHG